MRMQVSRTCTENLGAWSVEGEEETGRQGTNISSVHKIDKRRILIVLAMNLPPLTLRCHFSYAIVRLLSCALW